jgi:Ca2+-transporting ATPase
VHVLAIRSEHESLFKQGILSNKLLLAAVFFTFLLQLALIYIPTLQELFSLQALTLKELIICILLSLITFTAVEIEKWIRRRKAKRK